MGMDSADLYDHQTVSPDAFMPVQVKFGSRGDELESGCLVRIVCGGSAAPDTAVRDRVIHTGLRPLDDPAVAEDWFGPTPVSRGEEKGIYYARNEEACFGWLYFDRDDPLEAITRTAYTAAFQVFGKLGFRHLLRAWHYLPDIHAREDGVSRYRRFCRGRFAAFAQSARKDYCAATVIGTRSDFGVMCFMAAREAGVGVENPRQTSAWEYPLPAEGERPLFARAVCKAWGDEVHFYGSGTAGIVGHESMHAHSTVAQLREALVNLSALLDRSPHFAGVRRLTCLKVYIAEKGDIGAVRQVLDESEFAADSRLFFEGDICREELRVEIEASIIRSGRTRAVARH